MKLNIRTKLIGGFLIVVALLLAVFGVSFNGINTLANSADAILEETEHADHLMEIKSLVANEWQFYTDYSLTHDAASLAEAQSVGRDIAKEAADLRAMMTSAEAVELDAFLDSHKQFVKDGEAMAAVYVSGDWDGGNELMGVWDASGGAMLAALGDMEASSAADMQTAMENADSAQSSATTMSIIIAVIATLVATGLGFILSQSISKGVTTIAKALNQIAVGDLSTKVDVSSSDEIGQMAGSYTDMQGYLLDMAGAAEKIADGDLRVTVEPKSEKDTLGNAFSQMVSNLRGLIGQVGDISTSLGGASEQLSKAAEQAGQATQQIATTSQQVAKGAGEQSTALQQTTQGIEQLSKAIQQISQGAQEQAKGVERNVEIVNEVSSAVGGVSGNAQEASEGAKQAGEAAQKGAEMARQTVDGMGKIKDAMDVASKSVTDLGERSNEIGKIVATIDDIAAQPTLLALNAAIEAARAGEQGRGFAVVADEVRKLAERSSGATKEIADLITSIQSGVGEAVQAMEDGNKEVDDGYKLATEAGESLSDILKTVQEVSAQVEKISSAASDLSNLSNDMVKVTDGVSSVVQENTAATEEMSASSDQVSKSIEAVAGVSEENSAATQQVSASAEEMSAQVEEVVASAQSLAQMSRELQESVAAFKLSASVEKAGEAEE